MLRTHEEEGGWFRARWHFSFDRYRDPRQIGIGPLRVFNDDRLVPGAVQRMTLGSGAYHSERNGSTTEAMRCLQFWILPK